MSLAFALAAVAGACLVVQLLVVFSEVRRLLAFDRRLAVPRAQALLAGLRTGPGPGQGAALSLRGGGLALLRAGAMLVPVGPAEREKLSGALRRAGFAQRDALPLFLSAKLAVAVACAAGAGLAVASSEVLGQYVLVVVFAVIGGLVAGSLVPEYVLRFLGGRRLARMATSLPDALDLMVMCLESGLTFERALSTVAEELAPIEPNLASELRLIEAELRLGASRRDVLRDFEQRTEVEGLRDLARTLVQSERYGTPLTQSMRNIAANERVQRAARIAAQAERLPVLMTLPMMLFVVPGTVLLVAGPAFLTATDALSKLGQGGG